MGGENAIRQIVNGAEIHAFPGGGGEDVNRRLADLERNDLGNAERFLARHGQDLLHVRDVGWHHWTGVRWSPDGAGEVVKQRAHQTARSIMEEVQALQQDGPPSSSAKPDFDKRLEDLMKWSNASGNRAKLDAMVVEAAPYISVDPDMLDQDPLVLNLANGTLRLEGACDDLREHARADRLGKVMDVAYDPEAICPTFHGFLERVQPDADIRAFLQAWAGYCLTGITGEQKLVFNYGEGGNGKSVFIDLVAQMMGPYSASLPFSSLLRDDRKRGAEATPDLARLPGARLVRASEPEKGARFAEATIKAITGGEDITVRHLNQGFFDFKPQFKIWLAGNHKPKIHGQDRGIWRRLLLVPWLVNVPEDEQDLDLPAKLWDERSGVLNWLLDGVRVWLERGLVVPDSVRAATEDYKNDSDPLGRFIADCLVERVGERVAGAAMYEAYQTWCAANAERPWGQVNFGKALPERGVLKERIGGFVFYLDRMLVNVPTAEEPPPPDGPDDYGV